MPFYDYKCEQCETVFEVMHGVGETVESCPSCGGKARRLFHPLGVIFKGSGFYKTDYRSTSGNGGDKSSPQSIESEIEKAKETGSAAKEDSRPKKDGGSSS